MSGEFNIWPLLQIGSSIALAGLSWWNAILQGQIRSASSKAEAATAKAATVELQLAAHKLFVAENYSSQKATGQLEERIDKRLENIEGLLRQLVTKRGAAE